MRMDETVTPKGSECEKFNFKHEEQEDKNKDLVTGGTVLMLFLTPK